MSDRVPLDGAQRLGHFLFGGALYAGGTLAAGVTTAVAGPVAGGAVGLYVHSHAVRYVKDAIDGEGDAANIGSFSDGPPPC